MNKLGKVAVALAMVFSIGAAGAADTLLEYLTCTGAQYIDTGVRPNKTTHAVIKQRTTDTGTDKPVFGVRNAGYGFLCWFGKNPGTRVNPCIGTSGNKGDRGTGFSSGDIWTLDFSLDGVLAIGEVSGEVTTNTVYAASALAGHSTDAVSSKTLALFGLNDNGSIDGRKYVGDCFSFQLYDGGKLVRDLVPCKRDGVVCMYNQAYDAADPATGEKYYVNKTSTAFVAGPEKSNDDVLVVSGSPDDYGVVNPGYGRKTGIAVDESFVCSAPACCTNAEKIVAKCLGYVVYTNGFEYVSGTENSFTYTHPDCTGGAELVWQWEETHYKLDIDVVGGGTVDVEPQFAEPGSVFTVTATPNVGMKFWKWTGTSVTEEDRYRASTTVTLTEAKALTANFYDPATTPRIVRYVTPSGAGTKDGTSWENAMNSVATAYASVGENPGGGEVWVRYGTYTVTSVSMLPDITVRGGFAGDETLAEQADPENNPTIFSNGFDGNETWADGENTWPVWTSEGGKWWFNEPPQDGDRKMYSGWRSFGDSYAFIRYDNGALGHTEFHGLTFTRYWKSAIRVKSEDDDPVVFRRCRFLRLGWLTNNDRFVVQFIGTGVDMEDCEFVGLPSPIYVATKTEDSPQRTAKFKRCRISTSQECWNTSSGYSAENLQAICCGIAILRNVSLTVQDCRFDRNVSTTHGAVYANTLGDVLIENTIFSRGFTSSSENGGALGYYWKGPDAGTFTVRNCRFERCCTKAGGTSHINQGAAIGVWGGLNGGILRGLVENTAFIGNYTEGEGGESRGSSCVCFGASCYQQGGYCAFTFLNCLFEGNEAIHPKNGGAGTTVGNSWTQNPRAVFANCVFKDNVCGKIDADGNMVYAAEFGREGNPYFAFVNSVFENSDENMLPWTNGKSWFCFANCVTDQPNAEFGTGSSSCYRYEPMDAGVSAGLDPDPRTNGVVVARSVAEDSAYRRKGRPIWLGTDGEVYLYDAKGDAAKPWRSCRYGGGRKTDEEAAAVGVSRTVAPIPDAFAKDRSKFKAALGQLDFGVPGMLLLVR